MVPQTNLVVGGTTNKPDDETWVRKNQKALSTIIQRDKIIIKIL